MPCKNVDCTPGFDFGRKADRKAKKSPQPVEKSQRHKLASRHCPSGSTEPSTKAIDQRYYSSMTELWLEIHRERRILTHQRNGHAAVRRQRWIVGKQRLGVSLSRDRENVRWRQPFPFENLAHSVRPVRRQIERPIIALRWHEAGGGVTDDGYPQRRRLEGAGEFLD